MQNIIKESIKYIICFFLILSGLIIFLIASCCLPQERIARNMLKSTDLILEEGRYPQNFINWPKEGLSYLYASERIDTVTEYAVLTTAFLNTGGNAIERAFLNRGIYITEPENTVNMFSGNEEVTLDRCQYWMGLTAILRVMYCFFDMAAVRQFSLLLFSILSIALCIEIVKIGKTSMGIVFAIAFVMVNAWLLPFTPVLNVTFYLAMVFCLLILKYYAKCPVALWMFGFGIFTAFFDWMSTPLVTFGLPMLMILLIYIKENWELTFVKGFTLLLKNSMSWGAGYVATIVSKWIVGSIVLQVNIFEIGLKRTVAGTSVRAEGDADTFLGLAKQALDYNFFALYPFTSQPTKYKWVLIIGLIIIMGVFVGAFHKSKQYLVVSFFMLVVGLSPYAWYVVLKGHCHIHFWFTYRLQVISIMAIGLAFLNSFDTIMAKNKLEDILSWCKRKIRKQI